LLFASFDGTFDMVLFYFSMVCAHILVLLAFLGQWDLVVFIHPFDLESPIMCLTWWSQVLSYRSHLGVDEGVSKDHFFLLQFW
jgi:hypothetical protein